MNPLSFLAPYKLLIEIAVIGSLAGGVVFGIHEFLMHEQQIGYDRAVAEYTAKTLEAEKAARATETSLAKQLKDAQNVANEKDKIIRSLSASAGAANNGLRDTLATIRNGVPGDTATSLAKSVSTLTTILGDCSTKYIGMAEIADRHAKDSKQLFDSWPKVTP